MVAIWILVHRSGRSAHAADRGADGTGMKVLSGNRTRCGTAVVTLVTTLALASPAAAAPPIGADGQIHGCYVAKGKKKGQLRLLPPGKKCKKRKREKPITWSVQGPAGTPGTPGVPGAQGLQGESGISSEQLSVLIDRLNQQEAA